MTVDELYDSYEDRLRSFARRLTHNTEDIEDLVQVAFIRTLGHLPLLESLSLGQRRAWLFTTLRNLFYDRLTAEKRLEDTVERFLHEAVVDEIRQAHFEDEIFDLVPAKDRRLIEMRFVQALSAPEIADRLGLPTATVRSRLHLAIRRLRRLKRRFEDYRD